MVLAVSVALATAGAAIAATPVAATIAATIAAAVCLRKAAAAVAGGDGVEAEDAAPAPVLGRNPRVGRTWSAVRRTVLREGDSEPRRSARALKPIETSCRSPKSGTRWHEVVQESSGHCQLLLVPNPQTPPPSAKQGEPHGDGKATDHVGLSLSIATVKKTIRGRF